MKLDRNLWKFKFFMNCVNSKIAVRRANFKKKEEKKTKGKLCLKKHKFILLVNIYKYELMYELKEESEDNRESKCRLMQKFN